MKDWWDKKWSNISTCCKRKNVARNFALEIINFLDDKNIDTVLDLWCWEWLDSIVFKENWYDITWVDISRVALDLFKENVEQQNLEWIKIIEQDISDLNLSDTYDVIYANLSIQYFKLETMRIMSKRFESLLNKWWYLILRLKSTKDKMYWKWIEIEKDMYENNGQVRHFFTKEKIRDLFPQFEEIKIYHDKEEIHCQDLWKEVVSVKFIISIFRK